MRRSLLAALTAAIILNTPSGFAASTERILVPIAVRNIAGAFGSVWSATLWAHNADPLQHMFDTDLMCPIECVSFISANQTVVDVPFIDQPSGDPGLFVFVGAPDAIQLHLRVQDLSRQAATWGTEIPIIRESAALTTRTYLLDVPTAAQFRVRLRVYSFGSGPAAVHVRAFDPHRFNTDLGAVDLPVAAPTSNVNTLAKYKPGYGEIADLVASLPGSATLPQVAVEITPLTSGLRYWAFISVTHDSTQQFTLITP